MSKVSALSKPSLSLRHLLGAEDLSSFDITALLDLAEQYVVLNHQLNKKVDRLRGNTLINLFFEPSTRTQTSFEIAGKRLGADVVNMSVRESSLAKGETLLDTAVTLNAMRPDLLVVRHKESGVAELLAQKVNCSVVNAGDGSHEHPTQALLDVLTIRRNKGNLQGLCIAICGDILHSRVARSNIFALLTMGCRVRVVAPRTLLPQDIARLGVEAYTTMEEGLQGCDVVMVLRLQEERMAGAFIPSLREYYQLYGLNRKRLSLCHKDVIILHPGPMNRGVEIDSSLADDSRYSVIATQVEMGVAMRMAVLDVLSSSALHAKESAGRAKESAGRARAKSSIKGNVAKGALPHKTFKAHQGKKGARP